MSYVYSTDRFVNYQLCAILNGLVNWLTWNVHQLLRWQRPTFGKIIKSKAFLVFEIQKCWNVYFTDRPLTCISQTRTKTFSYNSKNLTKIDILSKFEVNWSNQSVRKAELVILTLVCKIHTHNRWSKKFSKFLKSLQRLTRWQNLRKKIQSIKI